MGFTCERILPSLLGSHDVTRMKLKDSIVIAAPALQVWAWLADPATWTHWNTKIKVLRRDRSGHLMVKELFSASFRLAKRRARAQVAVTDVRPAAKLELVHHFDYEERRRAVRMRFRLTPVEGGTRVSQEVDLGKSGIPLLMQAFIAGLQKLGRTRDFSTLENLKQAVEAALSAQQPRNDSSLAA
jgi:uncharacterized protein YndB with AHSA1/START domain